MAQRGIQTAEDKLCCSICWEQLKDLVTIPCGHSYCLDCVKIYWEEEDQDESFSCPQCRLRPGQGENAMLAELGEELTLLKNEPEKNNKQKDLRVQKIQQRIKEKEKDIKVLQQEVEAINYSADKAVGDSEKIFTDFIHLIKKRSSDLEQQIRSKQRNEVSRVKELQEKLQQELNELRRKNAELEQLSHTQDHTQFQHSDHLLSSLCESPPVINLRPLRYFDDVIAAVSEFRHKLHGIHKEGWTKISLKVTQAAFVLLPESDPKTRAEFLQYSRQLTLDPDTANPQLLLTGGNRKATVMREKLLCARHPDRFIEWQQVLSTESLTGRCYWEVEVGPGSSTVAVTYKDISRTGDGTIFGYNEGSWALEDSAEFIHNSTRTSISGPQSSRIGVFLDHGAGILSFYSVSETMSLLHRVRTTFTQPLYAGFTVFGLDNFLKLCELK